QSAMAANLEAQHAEPVLGALVGHALDQTGEGLGGSGWRRRDRPPLMGRGCARRADGWRGRRQDSNTRIGVRPCSLAGGRSGCRERSRTPGEETAQRIEKSENSTIFLVLLRTFVEAFAGRASGATGRAASPPAG